MIAVTAKGNFNKTERFLERMKNFAHIGHLDIYGREGVEALKEATPKDTGKTANSWSYEISHRKGTTSITWTNSNINKGVPIAVIIQYGHGTRSGRYVQGIDYINPAMRPVFEKIADKVWKEVTDV